jgi:hypothetical protein
VTGFALFWVAFSTLQLAAAGYLLAAVVSWRGVRFRPAPGHPFATLPTALIALAWVASVVLMLLVRDGEFARWVGTGGSMVVALASVFVLLRVR